LVGTVDILAVPVAPENDQLNRIRLNLTLTSCREADVCNSVTCCSMASLLAISGLLGGKETIEDEYEAIPQSPCFAFWCLPCLTGTNSWRLDNSTTACCYGSFSFLYPGNTCKNRFQAKSAKLILKSESECTTCCYATWCGCRSEYEISGLLDAHKELYIYAPPTSQCCRCCDCCASCCIGCCEEQ